MRLGIVCSPRIRRSRSVTASTLVLLLAALGAMPATGQSDEKPPADHAIAHSVDRAADHAEDHYYEPLPQDTGAAGLKLTLRKLETTGRLMQVVAHPDDEDGGMLTLEARGEGVDTLLMTLTRGEGGQNKLGSNLFDELGVLRTLELLAADRYYGVQQRFSRVADFGYSKTAEETFQKWHGHDIALGDIVRVIREFRPDVLVARFSGTERDGHGHHQASAILTKEAFRTAADPKQFPEQIAEGLQPWQAKKLYIGNVCSFGAQTCDPDKYTLKLNTGKVDPVLGTSYVQFALKGLRHQESQGLAAVSVPDGDRFTFYKLVDSVIDSPKDKDGHEQDFFDGIDTSLPGLAARLGDEGKKLPQLREIQANVKAAERAADDTAAVDAALRAAQRSAERLTAPIAGLPSPEQEETNRRVGYLLSKIERARALALNEKLEAIVNSPVGASADDAFMAVPGEAFDVSVKFSKPQTRDASLNIRLDLPQGWKSEVLKKELLGNEVVMRFRVHVPA
ncbi:MAG: PIG-L family deacetylase, partial [Terriglobales bacterium]